MKPLKANLHLHTASDPLDWIWYSEKKLIDKAAKLGYEVLSITCHNKVVFDKDLKEYANKKGILLIPGIEKDIEGEKHLLIINADKEAEKVNSFDDLRAYKKGRNCLAIAPHPYFLQPRICLEDLIIKNMDALDGIEYSYYYTWGINQNKSAEKIAEKYNKPMIGNSDCHILPYLDTTYSIIEADKNIESILKSIKLGKVKVNTKPLSPLSIGFIPAWLITKFLLKKSFEFLGLKSRN